MSIVHHHFKLLIVGNYNLQSNFKSRSIDDKLKVEHRGGKKYNRAKRLREVFMDFVEHQQGLHKSLALEEKMILQPSGEV